MKRKSTKAVDRVALARAINCVGAGGIMGQGPRRPDGVELEISGTAWRHSPMVGVGSPNLSCGGHHE